MGYPQWEEVAFREDLKHLEQSMNLEVVHVLEEPPDHWQGETGLVDTGILQRKITDREHGCQYFICGPEPFMNSVESGLKELGIDPRQIRAERFTMV